MAGKTLTRAQSEAVRAAGCGILVSAAAGSGKTSVLTMRCVHLVTHATPPCDVDELLVVTFTEAASAEMRDRIEKGLRQALSKYDNPRLRHQLRLVEHAHVSTLHSFCLQLIRQHFHRLGLDPAVRVIDDDEAALLRAETVRELFLDRYEKSDRPFMDFIDCYGSGRDERLMDLVVQTHALMTSVVEADSWMDHAKDRTHESATKPLNESALGKAYCTMIHRELAETLRKCHQAIREIPSDFPGYRRYIQNLAQVIEAWESTLSKKGYDALAKAMSAHTMDKLPPASSSLAGKDRAYALVDSARSAMKSGLLAQCMLFSSADWQDGMKRTQAHLNLFLDLVADFSHRYDHAKQAARGVDFADLERMALKLLREDPIGKLRPSPIARQCHQRFKHVLVDEYQDINEVQDAILHLVSTECLHDDQPSNLFCVGDVKQSIYRFRLAEPARFLEKEVGFREPSTANRGRVIDLQENFRSRAPLLEAINSVFKRLMTLDAAELDYTESHQLRPGLDYPTSSASCFNGSPIELHLISALPRQGHTDEDDADDYDRTEIEAMLIANRINQMLGRDGSPSMQVIERQGDALTPRPIQLSDIVILLRSPKYKAAQMADILRACGIPVQTDAGSGYFQAVEVRDMLALLSLLDNRQQDIPLAAVLRSPLAGFANSEDHLARIRLAYPKKIPFHQAAAKYAQKQDDELAAHLRSFFRQLNHWRNLVNHRPLAEVIWTIYEQTGYLAFVTGLVDGQQRYANLLHLHERAKQFGSFSRQGLYRFLQFLQNLQEEKETARPTAPAQRSDSVNIMSIHKSKGLEFPVVFVADLGKRHNFSDSRGSILVDRKEFVGMEVVDPVKQIRYPSLGKVLVEQRIKKQMLAEEMRLLYVAMTRAKEHLILVGTCEDKHFDHWQTWCHHTGPMPADAVLAGRTLLDWIGPVVAMESQSFQVSRHDETETSQWKGDDLRKPAFTDHQRHLAQLQPLTPPPPMDATAQRIIDSLSFRYPYHSLTELPAARSVTQWTKLGAPEPSTETEEEPRTEKTPGSLTEPRCVAAQLKPLAVDIGNTTHLVLQYLDFNTPADEVAVAMQINDFVTRRLISTRQARAVDIAGILWLLGSEIGHLMRTHQAKIHLELPFYLSASPSDFDSTITSTDPTDQVMLRGRMDVVIESPAGLIVIDYKTDRITPADVPSRTQFYQGQVDTYKNALAKITNQPISRVCLAFLSPQIIQTL